MCRFFVKTYFIWGIIGKELTEMLSICKIKRAEVRERTARKGEKICYRKEESIRVRSSDVTSG